ncbi:MAG: CHASE2 domain-containing protein [Okeania sp. SIO3B3]|nr:CHASE2 domain-containing protein [Okeania sp. SIO3B3]
MSPYKVVGNLAANHPTYVVRKQDTELYEKLLAGEYCYVFNARQMGKSSLRVSVMKKLRSQGCKCAVIDMTRLGNSSVLEKSWYRQFIKELFSGFDLNYSINSQEWIERYQSLPSTQILLQFIEEILFINFPAPHKIYIFLDEIDTLVSLPFKNQFLAFIRSCYNFRVEDENSDYHRLVFGFFGVATPEDLIRDGKHTPFNIGHEIELTELTFAQGKKSLTEGLKGVVDEPETVLKKVFDWSGGQPFLTQKICKIIVDHADTNQPDVDSLVKQHILTYWEDQDQPTHLTYIRHYLLDNTRLAPQLLRLYQEILLQEEIKVKNCPIQMVLRLSGIVIKKKDKLVVSNKIYRTIFNSYWVEKQLKKLEYKANKSSYNYICGGSLSVNHPTYVVRKQDAELYEKLLAGEYCYVFNARQMGKSSLRVSVMKKLRSQGYKCAVIDMSRLGNSSVLEKSGYRQFIKKIFGELNDFSVAEKSWYNGLIKELFNEFNLNYSINSQEWIESYQSFTSTQILVQFIEEILFINFPAPQKIYIFLDEIDTLISLPFKNQFLAFIRSCYNFRAEDENSDYHRLVFGFFGVATPEDLIRDGKHTPFNIGHGIELTELTFAEGKKSLTDGLKEVVNEPKTVLKKVFDWSGGQPFLTQKICKIIVDYADTDQLDIDSLVKEHILTYWEDQDEPTHLKYIHHYLLSQTLLAPQLLKEYQKILLQGEIKANDSPIQMILRLSGIVLKKRDKLVVFNKIYRTIFNRDWVEEQLANLRNKGQKTWPPNWKQVATLVIFLGISWQLSVQKFLLDRRVFLQAIYRQYTRQNLTNNIPPVLLVQIDDESIIKAKIAEPNPMRRDYLASLVKRVSELETRVIGIDYLLDRPHKRRDGGVGDRLLVEAIQTAVKKQQWIVFVRDEYGVSPEIASLNWSLEGNMTVLGRGRYLALPNFSNLKNMTFSSMLLLAYKFNYDKKYSNSPQPNLENQVNFFVQLSDYLNQEKEAVNYEKLFPRIYRWKPLTLFSYRLKQGWLHPIVDFSISYDQIYDCIPAWRLLESNNSLTSNYLAAKKNRKCEVTEIEDKVKQQVVIIAPGGDDNAGLKYGGDNFIPPMAFRYWNNDKNLTGGEIHAYMLHHFLTNRIVIPIPDFWMTWVGAFLGQSVIILLNKYPEKRCGWVGFFVVANFVYVIVSLQVYISGAILLPIVSPSVTFWVYFWLNKRRIKDFHNQ